MRPLKELIEILDRTLIRVIIVVLMLLVCIAQGGQARLAWDPVVGADSYVLYASTNQLSTTNFMVAANVGTNVEYLVDGLRIGQWNFGITAVRLNAQSDMSDVVLTEVLPKPEGGRVVLQYTIALTNEWNDKAFFRLMINP